MELTAADAKALTIEVRVFPNSLIAGILKIDFGANHNHAAAICSVNNSDGGLQIPDLVGGKGLGNLQPLQIAILAVFCSRVVQVAVIQLALLPNHDEPWIPAVYQLFVGNEAQTADRFGAREANGLCINPGAPISIKTGVPDIARIRPNNMRHPRAGVSGDRRKTGGKVDGHRWGEHVVLHSRQKQLTNRRCQER